MRKKREEERREQRNKKRKKTTKKTEQNHLFIFATDPVSIQSMKMEQMTTLMLFATDPKKHQKHENLKNMAFVRIIAFLLQIKDLDLATISYTILCSIITYSTPACYVTAACVLCADSEFG